jgi:hypothetical protein
MNRWNIPKELEEQVRARDTHCVYCGISFESTLGKHNIGSWEHILNDKKESRRKTSPAAAAPATRAKAQSFSTFGWNPNLNTLSGKA